MRAFIILALVAAAAADVSHLQQHQHHSAPGAEAQAQIQGQNADVYHDGYKQNYETSNGISVQEQGELKNAGRDGEALEVQGAAQWTSPEGQPIKISFVANENGYQPQGDHLPTPPPIPAAIARALEYIAAHPQVEESSSNRRF